MDFAPVPLPQENLGPVYDKALEGLGSWMPVELVKRCSKCGEVKGLGEFYSHKTNGGGKQGACKGCHSEWAKEYNQRPEVKARKEGRKEGSAVDGLHCSIEEFKTKVSRFFKPGMSWDDNWGNGPGKWHLDHIIPLSAFDLTNREQFLSAAHYSNYQPLWSEENLSKGDRF